MPNTLLFDSFKVFVAILLVGLVYNLIFYTTDIYYMNIDKDEAFDFAYKSLLTMWLPGSAAAAVLYFAYCKFVIKKK
jgi:hypothetical protein